MDEKTNLYVFAKKEVALLFIFVISIAITSFVIGVKVGKNYSYKMAGLDGLDRSNVELLSSQEELVENVVKDKENTSKDEQRKAVDETYMKLKDEFRRLDQIDGSTVKKDGTKIKEVTEVSKKSEKGKVSDKVISFESEGEEKKGTTETESQQGDKLSGKFTIQLGSYRSLEDAEKFANGFRVRGYNPIINEVSLPDRGTWYRVSLGSFDNIAKTKEYILKEKSLLRGTDYVIGRFD